MDQAWIKKHFWTHFVDLNCLPLFLLNPKSYGAKKFLENNLFWSEQKLNGNLSAKTFMTNSKPFKTALRLFHSCFKTIKDSFKIT